MSALYHLATLRRIEAQGLQQQLPLMERAGQAIAEAVQDLSARRILVVAGPGNNGGDGLVAARLLQAAGRDVEIWFTRGDDYRSDALDAFQRWQASGKTASELKPSRYDLIIDAIYGIGLSRALDARDIALIEALNASGTPILAIDTPSGLDAMTGATSGAAIRAQQTLTFLGDKPGLHTAAGRDHAGVVTVHNLGLSMPQADAELITSSPDALGQLRRGHDTHKGRFGSVAVCGGADGMSGAVLLAGRAALFCGAGRVFCGFLDAAPIVDFVQPELMLRAADSLLNETTISHWLIGPGLGQTDAARALLTNLIAKPQPLLLDADALNLLAADAALARELANRSAATILTPHPSEAARLLDTSTAAIQHDRIAAAQEIARRYRATVILKGSGSVITDADRYSINASGNAALSNAGQGDTLAGIMAALLAQGLSARDACECAVWLHGAAADAWKEAHPAGIGLTASEVALIVRDLLNQHVCGDDAAL